MMSAPKSLADRLDALADLPEVSIVETAHAITLVGLSYKHVPVAVSAAHELCWEWRIADAGGEVAVLDDLVENLEPYRVVIEKPELLGVRLVVTNVGLKQALANPGEAMNWQIADLRTPFQTGLISFSTWGSGDVFAQASELKSPRKLVREGGDHSLVPKDVRMWLVRGEPSKTMWDEPSFRTFAEAAAPQLIRALANEVPSRSEVVFNGPPRRTFSIVADKVHQNLQFEGFSLLQAVVSWVYEDNHSVEQRHIFLSSELARQSARERSIESVMLDGGADILQGARYAFQLSISELGKEALKSQVDLRKAVADDTGKAADNARSVAAALATAVATGIGMVAARTSSTADPLIITAVVVAVAVYLIAVCINALHHLGVQKMLRSEWRNRFYRFISDDDYMKMVTRPIADAEKPVRVISWLSLIGAFILIIAALSPYLLSAFSLEPSTTMPAEFTPSP